MTAILNRPKKRSHVLHIVRSELNQLLGSLPASTREDAPGEARIG